MSTAVSVAEVTTKLAEITDANDLITSKAALIAVLDNTYLCEAIATDRVLVHYPGGLTATVKYGTRTVEFSQREWDVEALFAILGYSACWLNSAQA